MIKLTQNQIVALFLEKIEKHLSTSRQGTYNTADPTEFRKGTAVLSIPYHGEAGYPAKVEVKFSDCTWGVSFELAIEEEKIVKVESGYFDYNLMSKKEGKWCRCSIGFEKLFTDLLIDGVEKDFFENDDDLSLMCGGNAE